MIVPEPATGLNNPIRALLWQRIDSPGCEWCALEQDSVGWRLQGVVLTEAATAPVLVHYAVALSTDWSTRMVEIAMRSGAAPRPRTLKLTVAPDQHWQIEREPAPDPAIPLDDPAALHGLIDVDLGFSPVTNTLPIRRLDLAIGEAVELTAAWVRFPELTIEPLPQIFFFQAEDGIRDESRGGAFVAEIEVDN